MQQGAWVWMPSAWRRMAARVCPESYLARRRRKSYTAHDSPSFLCLPSAKARHCNDGWDSIAFERVNTSMTVWLQFALCAGVIFFAGTKLCHYGDVLAEKT